MAKKNESHLRRPRSLLVQWTGLLAGPIAWALHMQANYMLVPWACEKSGGAIVLYVVTILALLITAGGAFAAWRGLQESGDEETDGPDIIASRAHFMGALGLFTSAMFFLVIIAQALPGFFFHPCQR